MLRRKARNAKFYDGSNVIGEQVALSRHPAGAYRTVRWVSDREVVSITAVSLELRFNADVLAEVKGTRTTPAV